jgi:hypothetical protein
MPRTPAKPRTKAQTQPRIKPRIKPRSKPKPEAKPEPHPSPDLHSESGLPPAPQDPAQLHTLLSETFGLSIPRAPLVPGHTAPFDYLCHAFFEGRGRWQPGDPLSQSPSPSELATAPIDCIVWANRGGGKTFLGAVATMLDLLYKPGIQVRILAGSLEQAARMHDHLRTLFSHDLISGLVDGRITDRRLRLITGSSAELLAQSQASVRGTRIQKLRCDEVELFDPMVWEAAQLTTRGRRCGPLWVRGGIECLSTMHVPHGIMARLVESCSASRASSPARRRLFKWGLMDVLSICGDEHKCARPGPIATPEPPSQAPSEETSEQDPAEPGSSRTTGTTDLSLPVLGTPAITPPCPLLPECDGQAKYKSREPGHISIEDALAQKSRVGQETWESEMLCLRPRRSGAVFPEFSPSVHIVRDLTGDPVAWIGGMDFGYRASVILWARLEATGSVCIVDERVGENVILDDHILAIRAGLNRNWPALSWLGVDPAGAAANDQTGNGSALVLREAGIPIRARRMSIQQGLSLVRARLRPADGPPRLFIHERCRRLIESIEKYHYPEDRPDSLIPVKDGHDHAVDALRYLMVNLDRPYRTKSGVYAG